jgi:hypothetical protein
MNKFLITASGVAMALVLSSAAMGAVTTFTSGTTISSSDMNTNFANINGNLTDGTCTKNAADDVGGMVRVGPICVDKYRARATIGACTGDGTTDCAGVVAVSTATGSPAADFSWAQAVRACANAGKRLLTPGEFMAAYISGALLETSDDTYDFVDAMLTIRSTNTATDPSGPGATIAAQGSYMGPVSGAGSLIQMISNVAYNLVNPDGGATFLHFRCAR